MFKNLKKEETLVLAVTFWVTVVIARTFLFAASILRSHNPRIIIEDFHIHHILIGIFFLILTFLSAAIFHKKKKIIQLAAIGAGAGLVVDEFSFFFYLLPILPSDYWSIGNFLAIILFGMFLVNLFRVTEKKSRFQFVFLPVMLLSIFLFGLFYDANPAISQAKEIRPIVKHLRFFIPLLNSRF